MNNNQKFLMRIYRLIACASLLMLAGFPPSGSSASTQWQTKVDSWVIETAAEKATEFLVMMVEQSDLSGAARLKTKAEKGAYVFNRLTETAARTQPPIMGALKRLASDSAGVLEFRPFWVVNAIWVRGDLDAVRELAQRPDVFRLYANPSVRLEESPDALLPSQPEQADTVEWGVSKVRAPLVWQVGFNGQGVVVGGQDTGYDWDHPALIRQYRGWNGFEADHNYSWHDAIHENDENTLPDNPCGFDSPVPCDDQDHGTHTMGTIVGDDLLGNQIGVAPGARWIGCRNMESGYGTPATYTECYQWFIAPTDLNNLNPRPDLAPDVINNSWRCPDYEGCTDPNVLKQVVENVRAAGILTVHSAGNNGNLCYSVNTPAAIYDASFTVGNTNSDDVIYYSSSRGPVAVDGSNRLKPDISAPGTSIRSSVPPLDGILYKYKTGTSMAAPHVAGVAALLLSANPALSGQVDALEKRLQDSAIPRTTDQDCGLVSGDEVPNNTYGWGRVDAWNAISVPEFQLTKTVSDNTYDPGQVITFTLQVNLAYAVNPTTNLVITDVLPAETSFITATLPHTRTGDTFTWGAASLAPGQPINVDLVVEVSQSASETLFNEEYSASSDDFEAIIGIPLPVYRARYYYFPWLPVQ